MNIYEKLAEIQAKLKAPKNQYNSFGGYNYRSCEDILEAVKPLAHKYNAVVVVSDELCVKGDRYYVVAHAMLIDTEGEGKVTATAYARESDTKKGMDSSQITGASSSYARKYALNGLFAIDDTKDSDGLPPNEGTKKTKQEPQKSQPIKEKDNQIIDKVGSDMYEAGNKSGFNNEEIAKIALAKFKAKPMELDIKQVNLLKEQFANNGEALRKWLNAKA